MTHETAEGINHAWDHFFTPNTMCVFGCGKLMATGAEGLCFGCGRTMWAQELEDAAQDGNVRRGLQVVGWMIEMECAA